MKISPIIAAAVAHLRVIPSVPPGRVVVIDGAEPAAKARPRDGTSALGLFIDYVDSAGSPSSRRIVCRSYDISTHTIMAHCFEREALREFRVDRIESAACTETGEIFDLDQLVAALRRRGLPIRDAGLKAVLRVLTFLMRCDGVHHTEQAAIEEAVTSYVIRFDGDDTLVHEGLRLAATLAPDGPDFMRALRWIGMRRNGPALARFVRQRAAAVIDADGWHSDPEVNFGIELDRALAAVAARA